MENDDVPFKHSSFMDPELGERLISPPSITQECLDRVASFTCQPTDVFITTYPKSGTTWMQKIVFLIESLRVSRSESSQSVESSLRVIQAIPWLEAPSFGPTADVLQRRAFKSHLPWSLIPKAEGVKYIYVYRNPKDVCVSMYHHTKSWKHFEFDGDFSSFFRCFIQGKVEFGHWGRHVLRWWEESQQNPNICFLSYEDMINDLPQQVYRVASFLDMQLTENEVADICSQCHFSSMQNDPASNYSLFLQEHRKENSANFIRKGEIGDWKNYFSEEQNQEMDQMINDYFNGVNIPLQFE